MLWERVARRVEDEPCVMARKLRVRRVEAEFNMDAGKRWVGIWGDKVRYVYGS